ncbi:hypothetical protein [Rhodococcus erythropolis]|uniref:hypothetical protein n=1 Tax=Rhodococcus erythropolis TaxID=1833 RepID=UPI00087886C2|nr:hypothetical protein [Rhodococcus erythropolis]
MRAILGAERAHESVGNSGREDASRVGDVSPASEATLAVAVIEDDLGKTSGTYRHRVYPTDGSADCTGGATATHPSGER